MLTTQAEQLMQQYRTQFMQDCSERAPKLTAFIQEILQGRHLGFSDENKSFDQAVALIMEYEYQDFSVYGWLRNQNGGYLGDGIINFPKECLPKFDADVEDEIYGLEQDENEEDEEDEEEAWDAVDDFYSGLHETNISAIGLRTASEPPRKTPPPPCPPIFLYTTPTATPILPPCRRNFATILPKNSAGHRFGRIRQREIVRRSSENSASIQ